MFGATVAIPFIITPALCMEKDDPSRGYVISTLFFVSGLVTLIQATVGVRLPIIQGGTFSFFAPTFAILSLSHNQCPADFDDNGWGDISYEDKTEEWQKRMREVQGAIIVASLVQVIIGYFGIVGLVLKYITPLTIVPAVSMIGLALFDVAGDYAAKNWGVAMGTIICMTLFSQYLRNVSVPWLSYKKGKIQSCRVDMFKLFPVLMTILFMWFLCAIITLSGGFDETDPARTDLKLSTLYSSQWIRIPYPFQWGWPTVTIAGVFGMMAGVLASAIESIGDYYACARLSGAPPPPTHAINRGIGTEGLGCIIAGIFGTGNGTTSYSENIGAIGVTKVGSRRVIQYGGLIMIFFGLISKFGAVFVLIPEPIVGGIFCIMFGMIAAVGLSNLQFVNLNSTRNLFVLGFSVFFALVVSKWLKKHPDAISFGDDPENAALQTFAQVIKVLLETSMFVAGFLGFFLDNTIPGTPEERGLIKWNAQHEVKESFNETSNCYDLPFGMNLLRKWTWTQYLPFSPTFKGWRFQNKVRPQ
eukprot:04998.XXX_115818_113896_1 [CDS] Oithona nana genome sequencing.